MKFRLKWFQSQFPLPPNYSKETKEIENQPTVGWDHFNLNFVFTYNIYPASVQATTCTNWRKNNTVGRDSKPGGKAGNPEQGYQRTQWRVSTVYSVPGSWERENKDCKCSYPWQALYFIWCFKMEG